MTTVVLERHGQSEANVRAEFAGHSNAPLTELGRHQAEETAAALDRYRFDRIYTSDLLRARQTAAAVARRQGLTPILDPAFREIRLGKWEGVRYADMPALFPASYNDWEHDLYHCRPEGGEPVADLIRRVCGAFDRVVAENRGKTVLITTHATPVLALTARAHGYPPEEIGRAKWSRNASLTVIEVEDDGTMRICAEGQYDHISPAYRPWNID